MNRRWSKIAAQVSLLGVVFSMRKFSYGLLAVSFLVFSQATAHGAGTPDILKWSYATGLFIDDSSPAISSDGTIYVGSLNNNLYAINPNGTLKWSYATGGVIFSSPAIGTDGTIYVGSYDGKLYAINPHGILQWSYATGGAIWSSPALGSDGTIYVGSDDYKLYAINPNGTLQWSYATGVFMESSPAIGTDGTIYVGGGYNLYAINPNGTLKWSYATGIAILSSPAIGSDGTIYVGSYDDKLYAINPNGTLQWSYTTGGMIGSSPAIGTDGTIYVGSNDYKLYAINPNGTLQWSYATGGGITSSPAIGSDGTIYVGSYDDKLYAICSSSSGLANSPWPMFHHDLEHTGLASPVSKPITIDIEPGSINPKSNGKIPVAILSTKDFNALTQIDLISLTFGRTGDEKSLAFCHGSEDVNKDKLQDLVCHFYTQDTGFKCGDTEGILKGKTKDGTPIEGSDSVKIGPCK